jgi:hypothetical protein
MARSLPVLALGAALLFAPFAGAAGQATPDEAKAMAIKAAGYLKSVGPDKAFAEFNAKDGPWRDRDLYVIVATADHVVVADGGNANLIGHSTANLKDVDGKPISQMVEQIKDAGWVNYKWQNPSTKVVEPKAVYWVRVNAYTVGVGAYDK